MEKLIDLKMAEKIDGRMVDSTIRKSSSEVSLYGNLPNGDLLVEDRDGKKYLLPLYNGVNANPDVALFSEDAYNRAVSEAAAKERRRNLNFFDKIRKSKAIPVALLMSAVSTFTGCDVPEKVDAQATEVSVEESILTGAENAIAAAPQIEIEEKLVVTEEMLDEYADLLKVAMDNCITFAGVDKDGNPQYAHVEFTDEQLKDFTVYVNNHIIAKTNNELYLKLCARDEDFTRIENNARFVADAIVKTETTSANVTLPWEVCIINPETQKLAHQGREMIEEMKDMIAAFDKEQLAIGSDEYNALEVEIQKRALDFMHIKRNHTNYEFGAEWAINNIYSRILRSDNDIANFVNNNSQLVRVKYDENGKVVDSIGYYESLVIMDYGNYIDYSDYKLEFRKAAKDPELNPEGLGELTHLCIDDTVNTETLTGMADLRRDCINSNSFHK